MIRFVLLVLAVAIIPASFACETGSDGCGQPCANVSAKATTDDSLDWLAGIFQHDMQRFGKAVNSLVSLRYYNRISSGDRDILRMAWSGNVEDNQSWNTELLASVPFRIILAEVLAKHDEVRHDEYYQNIKSNLESDSARERAYAGLSIGMIGSAADIESLVELLLNDEHSVAIQAGFGLIALQDREALVALEESLEALSNTGDQEDSHTVKVLSEYLESLRMNGFNFGGETTGNDRK